MQTGDLLISWTVRAAMLCYATFLVGTVAGWRGQRWSAARRVLWIGGCGLFLAHVVSAFHFYHHWSNSHAVDDTARQTQELLGFEFGRGIYFSYLFAAIWTVDAAWWLVCPDCYQSRSRWLACMVHSYIFFIAFSGTVIFKSGHTRWAGIVVCGLLAACWLRAPSSYQTPAATAEPT